MKKPLNLDVGDVVCFRNGDFQGRPMMVDTIRFHPEDDCLSLSWWEFERDEFGKRRTKANSTSAYEADLRLIARAPREEGE